MSYSDGNIWYTEDNAASIGIYEAGGLHSRAVFSGGHLRALSWLETRTEESVKVAQDGKTG